MAASAGAHKSGSAGAKAQAMPAKVADSAIYSLAGTQYTSREQGGKRYWFFRTTRKSGATAWRPVGNIKTLEQLERGVMPHTMGGEFPIERYKTK